MTRWLQTWLHRLGVEYPGSTVYLLDSLVTKSLDANLPYISSLGVQAFVQHNATAAAKPSSQSLHLVVSLLLGARCCQTNSLNCFMTSCLLWFRCF